MSKKYKNSLNLMVLALSVVLVICLPFVFDLKTTVAQGEFRGIPFDWVALYPDNGVSFKGLGFLLNVIIFYLSLTWIGNRLKKSVGNS